MAFAAQRSAPCRGSTLHTPYSRVSITSSFSMHIIGLKCHEFFFFFFWGGGHHFYFPAQLVGDFTLSDLRDKPWSQVSSLLPPDTCLQFLSRIGFSIPTARRFSSNVLVGVVSRLVCKIRVIWFADIRVWWFHPLAFKKSS